MTSIHMPIKAFVAASGELMITRLLSQISVTYDGGES